MLHMPSFASHPLSCTAASVGLAGHPVEEDTHRFCRPFPRDNVPHYRGCAFKLAGGYPNGSHNFTAHYRSLAICVCTFRVTGAISIRQWTPIYTSDEFARFMKQNGIKHILSAPYHPSSYGLAERFVQTFKKAMRAGEKDGLSLSNRLSKFLLPVNPTRDD